MKHNLQISVSKHQKSNGIVSCKSVTLRERILRLVFGKNQQTLILMPGDTVEELTISEVKEGAISNEPNKTIA